MASLLEYPAVADPSLGGRMVRRADGLLHYTGLTPCLTELLASPRTGTAGARPSSRRAADRGSPTRSCGTSASRVAGGLLEQGVGIGDRVGVRMPNGVRWVQAFLGVLLDGGVPVPVHPGHGSRQLPARSRGQRLSAGARR